MSTAIMDADSREALITFSSISHPRLTSFDETTLQLWKSITWKKDLKGFKDNE